MADIIRKLGHFFLGKLLFRVTEYNKPDLSGGSCILAPNHTSNADGPIIWTHNENIRIMAKKECFRHKFMARFFLSINVVPVDRSRRDGVEIREAIRYLSRNEPRLFMLFPQGTISDINKNALSRVRRGAFYLSAVTRAPILPVFIEQPRLFRRCRVVYGEKFAVGDIHGADGRIDKELLTPYRALWMEKVLELQSLAEKIGNRPVRKLRLKKQHRDNNDPGE